MILKILDFLERNSQEIRGVSFHRHSLTITLTNSEEVFNTSDCTNQECAVIMSELNKISHLRRK